MPTTEMLWLVVGGLGLFFMLVFSFGWKLLGLGVSKLEGLFIQVNKMETDFKVMAHEFSTLRTEVNQTNMKVDSLHVRFDEIVLNGLGGKNA
jgi:hypothetical protein